MYEPNLIDYTRVQSDEYIVIDTDAGADDAMAILLLLTANVKYSDPYFDVVAITCVYGNTELSNVEQNVLKTLTIANETKVTITKKNKYLYILLISILNQEFNFFIDPSLLRCFQTADTKSYN